MDKMLNSMETRLINLATRYIELAVESEDTDGTEIERDIKEEQAELLAEWRELRLAINNLKSLIP